MSDSTHPGSWMDPADDPRYGAPSQGGELATLVDYLRAQRLTLELKCDGLDAAQLACRSVEPSKLSLLGLVRHLANVEHYWFTIVMAGGDSDSPFTTPGNRDAAFDGAVADPTVVAEAWTAWREEVTGAEAFVKTTDLDVSGSHRGQPIELREVLIHLIEEYARHNGHADLLRERIDGRTGQ